MIPVHLNCPLCALSPAPTSSAYSPYSLTSKGIPSKLPPPSLLTLQHPSHQYQLPLRIPAHLCTGYQSCLLPKIYHFSNFLFPLSSNISFYFSITNSHVYTDILLLPTSPIIDWGKKVSVDYTCSIQITYYFGDIQLLKKIYQIIELS